jgi:PilZ domain-containing protein
LGFIELIKNLLVKQGWNYSERRGKKRVKCRFQASLLHGNGMVGVDVCDISVVGMKLMCLAKVKKGAMVQLKGVKQYNQATVHEVNCKIEWVRKESGGWMAGVRFIDTPEDMSKSWLYWELKDQGVRMTSADTKRGSVRVRTNIPARIVSSKTKSKAKIVNLSPDGAMVQVLGQDLSVNEVVALQFGPLENLPKISAQVTVASMHVEGAPVYGLKILSYSIGGAEGLKQYLDFFFKP